MDALLIYLIAGAIAGVAAGLFGVGGGLVIVPVLAFVFERSNMSPEVVMHVAVGSSLACIVATSISSVRSHVKLGGVVWPVFKAYAPGLFVGALIGGQLAGFMPRNTLQLVFALFVLAVSVQMFIAKQPPAGRGLPGKAGLASAGLFVGVVSAIVGIGGGSLTVPFLVWCNTEMKKAVGTSAAGGLPIAVAGAISFLVAGWGVDTGLQYSTGYLYWPAIIGIVATSFVFAPLGAKLSHVLPAKVLKRCFAGFLVLVGGRMLYGVL